VFGVPPPDFCSPTLDFCQLHTVARPRLTVLFLPVLLYPSEHIQRENSVVTGLQQNAKGNQYWVTSARLRLRHVSPLLRHPLATCRPFVPFVMCCLRPIVPPSPHCPSHASPLSHRAFVTCCLYRVALRVLHRHVATLGSGLPRRAFHAHLRHARPFCHTSAGGIPATPCRGGFNNISLHQLTVIHACL
jgi:hypothetical protein